MCCRSCYAHQVAMFLTRLTAISYRIRWWSYQSLWCVRYTSLFSLCKKINEEVPDTGTQVLGQYCNIMCVPITDIHQRSQTSYSAWCNGIVSHGVQFGGLRVFAIHTCKRKCKQIRSRSSRAIQQFTRVCLHLHTWWTGLRENLKTPNLSPMPGSRWRRFWDL